MSTPSRLTTAQLLAHLEAESARFREAITAADPSAAVPGCPEWTAEDLLWHLTGVQAFWAWILQHRPEGPERYQQPERPEHQVLLAAFDTAHGSLLAALRDAPVEEQAWTWAPKQTVGFILRRQAHEALIHRVDAEQSVGQHSLPASIDPDLARDGVVEVLEVMYGGCPPWGTITPIDRYLKIAPERSDGSGPEPVWVQLGWFSGTDPDGVDHEGDDLLVVDDPGVEPDVVIAGPMGAVDQWLWHRTDDWALEVTGDLEVLNRFRIATGGEIR